MSRLTPVLALALVLLAPSAHAKKPILVPLIVSVAPKDDGKPVQEKDWIDAQIAEAERLLGPAGLHFEKRATRSLGSSSAKLETKKDRDALAAELQKDAVNVMLVGSLRDVDDVSRLRMGVHWRPQTDLKKHYVILSATAMGTTLAHELGHYFGLAHDGVTNNLMSYSRDDDSKVFVSEAQKKTLWQFANISIAAKEIKGS